MNKRFFLYLSLTVLALACAKEPSLVQEQSPAAQSMDRNLERGILNIEFSEEMAELLGPSPVPLMTRSSALNEGRTL